MLYFQHKVQYVYAETGTSFMPVSVTAGLLQAAGCHIPRCMKVSISTVVSAKTRKQAPQVLRVRKSMMCEMQENQPNKI